jgi:predicted phage baseplate assembly protein
VSTPVLDPRDAGELLVALERRLPGYLDAVTPHPGGAGHTLLAIYARYLHALALRIDEAPDKNELAFLDQLGLSLLPAQAARAPVVFETIPGAGNGRAPAGTRLGAKGPDPSQPLVFETERAIGLAEARLSEVVTVWPGRDAYADHSAAAIGGSEFVLWDQLVPVAHELYVGHDLHLALTGAAGVDLEIALARGGSEGLAIEWSYWDGDGWRSLPAAPDGTVGLTRSGRVQLHSDCAAAKPVRVHGFEHYWLRGRLRRPLAPGAVAVTPEIDRLGLRTVIDRPVSFDGTTCAGGLVPEHAFAEGAGLDLTKTAYVLGRQAGADSALYLACEEAFGRPGAQVTVCLKRSTTPEDSADAQLANYELGVEAARQLVENVRALAQQLIDTVDGLIANELAPTFENLIDDAKIADVQGRCNAALAALRDAAGPGQTSSGAAFALALNVNPVLIVPPPAAIATVAAAILAVTSAQIVYDIAVGLRNLSSGAPANLTKEVDDLRDALAGVRTNFNKAANGDVGAAVSVLGAIPGILATWAAVAAHLTSWPATSFADATLPGVVADAKAVYERLKQRVNDARTKLQTIVKPKLEALRATLADLSPVTVAAAAGVAAPKLDDPRLVWEYWDGVRWRTLVAPTAADPNNLLASGTFGFTVPVDWEPVVANEIEARWLRARLVSGAYARIRTVSWQDQGTKEIKYMAIVEPRPPAVDALRIGYRWESAPAAAQRCLTLNDFQWADVTDAAAGRGTAFAPFIAMDDRTPALYLGFDGPLPADLIGVLLDIEEVPGDETGPPLEWQYWDGAGWQRIAVEDETAHLALPGIAYALWPGVAEPPAAVVVEASGDAVRLRDARDATRFGAGELVWLQADGSGRLATVTAVSGDTITLAAPLDRDLGQGTLARAGLARFGTPRTWLRARMRADGEPRRSTVRAIAHNAVWAAEMETVADELLGSGDGQPRQALFFARTPVLVGQQIEVRELDGARAAVDYPTHVAALASAGIAEADLRVVRDPRTGAVRELWVPWRERPHLFFSAAADRHYTVERTRGRLLFGDGVHGAIPPAGSDNIRAHSYRSGGGTRGNVGPGAIDQVLAGVLVAGVRNPRAAEGGAEREPDAAVRDRGPKIVRCRNQAIAAADYEALAREASPAVAVARAAPAGAGGPAGVVTVVVVPRSPEPRPSPSLGLRRQVAAFLRARTPASLGAPVAVVAPTYLPVGVAASIVPTRAADAGVVAAAATAALEAFLHPLTGGPDGAGWPFGRDVHASDVAALLEWSAGVDSVASLTLLLEGSPQGDHVAVPGDRLVCAGPVLVTLRGEGD